MARLLMKNASHIVTCDPSDTVYTDSNLLMEDGVITYIGPEEQQAEEVIDAAGCIIYPGLINTHHHLYQTFSRNLPQVQNLELFDLLRPPLRFPAGAGGGAAGRTVRRRGGSGHPDVRLPWQHGPEQEGRRPAAGQCGADRG